MVLPQELLTLFSNEPGANQGGLSCGRLCRAHAHHETGGSMRTYVYGPKHHLPEQCIDGLTSSPAWDADVYIQR